MLTNFISIIENYWVIKIQLVIKHWDIIISQVLYMFNRSQNVYILMFEHVSNMLVSNVLS